MCGEYQEAVAIRHMIHDNLRALMPGEETLHILTARDGDVYYALVQSERDGHMVAASGFDKEMFYVVVEEKGGGAVGTLRVLQQLLEMTQGTVARDFIWGV